MAGQASSVRQRTWPPNNSSAQTTSVASDIYSLGLVLYEIFTGETARRSGSRTGGQDEPGSSSTPSNPSDVVDELDPSVERIIMRCLDADPEQRPRSVAEVAAALPGSDPLAAALAAGETPSPQMVAAAGKAGWLSPPVACACLAGVIVGLVLVAVLAQRSYLVNRLPLEKKPDLRWRMTRRMLLRAFGYTDPPADTAFGFAEKRRDYEYVGQLELERSISNRRELLKTGRWPGIRFWYRQSPRPMFPAKFRLEANRTGRARVYVTIPAWNVPGMIGVQLDPRGHLRWFRAVPPLTIEMPEDGSTTEPDWSKWFSKLPLDFNISDLTPTDARRTPPDAYDHLMAWEGTWSGSDEPLYVQAAAFRGHLVYFEVMHLCDFERGGNIGSSLEDSPRSIDADGPMIVDAALIVALVLALWNLRTGRGDRRGALRTAMYVFVLEMAIWLLQAGHSIGVYESRLSFVGVALAADGALVMWVCYSAIEPFVRRYLPEVLISWSRLLGGQYRDPRVGRDLLAGILVGICCVIMICAAHTWLGLDEPPEQWPITLMGPFALTGAVLSTHIICVIISLLLLIPLLLLRPLVPYRRLAVIGPAALLIVFTATPRIHNLTNCLVFTLVSVVLAYLLVRLGMLAFIAASTTAMVLRIAPITTDSSIFYYGDGLSVLLLIAAFALLGFYTAIGGKSIFGEPNLSPRP